MNQKNFFNFTEKKNTEKKPQEKPKQTFPEVSLKSCLSVHEASADSVFWHRILLNKTIRSNNEKLFLKIISNEINIKSGDKPQYMAIQDSTIKSS